MHQQSRGSRDRAELSQTVDHLGTPVIARRSRSVLVVASAEPLRPSSSVNVTTTLICVASARAVKDGAQSPKLALPESNRSSVAPGLTRIGAVQHSEPVSCVTAPFTDD